MGFCGCSILEGVFLSNKLNNYYTKLIIVISHFSSFFQKKNPPIHYLIKASSVQRPAPNASAVRERRWSPRASPTTGCHDSRPTFSYPTEKGMPNICIFQDPNPPKQNWKASQTSGSLKWFFYNWKNKKTTTYRPVIHRHLRPLYTPSLSPAYSHDNHLCLVHVSSQKRGNCSSACGTHNDHLKNSRIFYFPPRKSKIFPKGILKKKKSSSNHHFSGTSWLLVFGESIRCLRKRSAQHVAGRDILQRKFGTIQMGLWVLKAARGRWGIRIFEPNA